MSNEDREKGAEIGNHDEPVVDRLPGDISDARMSPVLRQLVMIALVAILTTVLITVVKSRANSDARREAESESQGSALNPNQAIVSQAAKDAVELKTEQVELEQGARALRTKGMVHFSPYDIINVSPRLTGKVRTVFVKVGDRVTIGQPLAEFISSDAANAVDTARDADQQLKLTDTALGIARKQFKLGNPEVTSAEAALISAHEATLFNKRMLDLTREQNSIGGFTDKPLTDAQSAAAQADTQIAQDTKDLALFQKAYDRTVKLFAVGTAAKQDVEVAEDALGKAKDAVTNDREQARIAHQTLEREQKAYNTRLYANQTVRQAETNYEQAVIAERAAGTALSMVKATLYRDLKQAEHDYETARNDAHAAHVVLSTYDNPTGEGVIVVKSPAVGAITARNVNPGQIVDQSGVTPWQMFTIVNAKRVYVDAQVYEKDMNGVRLGQIVTATSDALPAGFKSSGLISYIAPGLDPVTHTLSVRAEMDNSAGLLKDGMYISSEINLGSDSPFASMAVVPLTAVVHDGNSDYIFVSNGNGAYDRREVTLGEQRGEGKVVIIKGLKGGETIVTHGALYLGSGGTTAD